jgi:hypothetical protein
MTTAESAACRRRGPGSWSTGTGSHPPSDPIGGGRCEWLAVTVFAYREPFWTPSAGTGASWMLRMGLCVNPGRSRHRFDAVPGPRTAYRYNEAAIDDRISTEAKERFVFHVREIDATTLSPVCSQPSPQSVTRVLRPSNPHRLRRFPASRWCSCWSRVLRW